MSLRQQIQDRNSDPPLPRESWSTWGLQDVPRPESSGSPPCGTCPPKGDIQETAGRPCLVSPVVYLDAVRGQNVGKQTFFVVLFCCKCWGRRGQRDMLDMLDRQRHSEDRDESGDVHSGKPSNWHGLFSMLFFNSWRDFSRLRENQSFFFFSFWLKRIKTRCSGPVQNQMSFINLYF